MIVKSHEMNNAIEALEKSVKYIINLFFGNIFQYKAILQYIAKCQAILKNESTDLPHNKEQIKEYRNDMDDKVKSLLNLLVTANDPKLFKHIQNIQNRFNAALEQAYRVSFDEAEIRKASKFGNFDIVSNSEYQKQIREFTEDFDEEKSNITKRIRNKWGGYLLLAYYSKW